MSKLIEQLNAARRAGVPIVAINTPDQPAAATLIAAKLQMPDGKGETAVFGFDFVRGLHAKNKAAVNAMGQAGLEEGLAKLCPFTMLGDARDRLPFGAVLLYMNAQRFIGDAAVTQAVMNLRDQFKGDGRMLILIGNAITLPPELATDVVVFTEELPDDAKLTEIVAEQVADNASQFTKRPDSNAVKRAAQALRGTSAFGAEQLTTMSFRAGGIDNETLSIQARAVIETTQGLTFEVGKEKFDDIGGLEFAKSFGHRYFSGPKRPNIVVRVEEIEKAMAGAKGDLSGTSSDSLQVFLSSMEDNGWSGMIAYGAAGTCKSLFGKSLANTHDAKAMVLDLNACKGSLVGQSERQIRQTMSVIKTLGGDRVFFIASCNGTETLGAALQRRFRVGVWYFDLPDDHERQVIWGIQRAKFGIEADDPTPDEQDLTGADIRNICEQAYVLNCSLAEARKYVVPLKTQSPQDIAAARALATGRFIDASRGGVYNRGSNGQPTARRKVQVSA